ncbi:hypothetical protein [Aquimonas voraii]|uniref:hypothetical protein n=1 Tax=Aquimonas voraii TaxID=265719 RepID=UPI00115FC174|nr:hypothetical protein [Aquimonas voraii]
MKPLKTSNWLSEKRRWEPLFLVACISIATAAALVYLDHSSGKLPISDLMELCAYALGRAIGIAVFPIVTWPFFRGSVALSVLAISVLISFPQFM